jgi:hypothetical protein
MVGSPPRRHLPIDELACEVVQKALRERTKAATDGSGTDGSGPDGSGPDGASTAPRGVVRGNRVKGSRPAK